MINLEFKERCASLLVEWGLDDWEIRVKDMGNLLGQCDGNRKMIVIGRYYLENNPQDKVWDTVLHEVAHALTPGHGHDAVWRAMAVKLGCIPRACSKEANLPQSGKYKAECGSCGRVFHKHRIKSHTGYYCTKCGSDKGRLNFEEVKRS